MLGSNLHPGSGNILQDLGYKVVSNNPSQTQLGSGLHCNNSDPIGSGKPLGCLARYTPLKIDKSEIVEVFGIV